MKKAKPRKVTPKLKPVASPQGTHFVDTNPCAVSPTAHGFEPTEASPINQHKRMAGVS